MRRAILSTLLVLAFAGSAAAAEKGFSKARAALLKGLKSNAASDRAAAVYAVDGFDSSEAARLLVRAVLSRDDRARVIRAGVQLAGALRSAEAVEVLVEEAKKGAWTKRARVLEALGSVEHQEALSALLLAAYDKDPRVRISAILALEHSKDPKAAVAVGDGLKADLWPVRSAAMYVLGRMKDDDMVVELIRRLGKDGEKGRLVEDAGRALRRISGKNFGTGLADWAAWYSRTKGGEAISFGPPREKTEPMAQLAGVKTTAKRVLFVLAVNDTMNHKIIFDADRVAPPDIQKAGGPELARWRRAKTKLDLARLWIAWAIDHLDPETEFSLVTYGISANASFSSFIPATPANREKGKKRVLALSASGNANLYDGLRRIYTLVSKDPLDLESMAMGPEVVFYLADGAADEGLIKSAFEAFEEAERWNRYRQIRFNTFGMGDHDPRVLADLAGMIPDGTMRSLP
jgi:hypothetical protein